MRNMARISFRAALVCVSAVMSLAPSRASAEDVTIRCDVMVRPIWSDLPKVMQRLEDDPFKVILEIYRSDLDQLAKGHEEWMARAHEWLNNTCLPSLAAANAHRSSCGGAHPTSTTASCQRLLSNAARMDAVVQAESVQINRDLDILERKLRSAMDRANDVLKPDVTEQLFRRLVGRFQKAVAQKTMRDCDALAILMGALARRTGGDAHQLAKVAGRVLAKGVSGGVITLVPVPEPGVYVEFNQIGFRAFYLDTDVHSQNQVRHFVGYFIMGMIGAEHGLTSRLLIQIIATHRDKNQPADHALGLVAANLGAELIVHPEFLFQDLERKVRDTVCR